MVQYEGEEYLTPVEAASLLGVTRRTLDRYADDKRIRKYRRGFRNNIVYKRSDVEQLRREIESVHPVDEE